MRTGLVLASGVAVLLACAGPTAPAGLVDGTWQVDSTTLPPPRVISMTLTQHGTKITGSGSAMGVDVPIAIAITGSASALTGDSAAVRLHLVFDFGYSLTADFAGTLSAAGRLAGTATYVGLSSGGPVTGVLTFSKIPPPPTGSTGLEGVVRRGPITPVCQVNVPCDAPFSAAFLVWQGLRIAARFTSDTAGNYVVYLSPGSYTIVPDSGAPIFPKGQTRPATVGPVGITHLDLEFDTGIR